MRERVLTNRSRWSEPSCLLNLATGTVSSLHSTATGPCCCTHVFFWLSLQRKRGSKPTTKLYTSVARDHPATSHIKTAGTIEYATHEPQYPLAHSTSPQTSSYSYNATPERLDAPAPSKNCSSATIHPPTRSQSPSSSTAHATRPHTTHHRYYRPNHLSSCPSFDGSSHAGSANIY